MRVSQEIATEQLQLKLQPEANIKITGYCQHRPEYLPLEETASNTITLQNIRSSSPTDILVAVEIPSLTVEKKDELEKILTVELTAEEIKPISQTTSITYTTSYSKAQQTNAEVDRDRLAWLMNQSITDLLHCQDPHRTGELLTDLHINASKSGRMDIASQAQKQYQELEKSG